MSPPVFLDLALVDIVSALGLARVVTLTAGEVVGVTLARDSVAIVGAAVTSVGALKSEEGATEARAANNLTRTSATRSSA